MKRDLITDNKRRPRVLVSHRYFWPENLSLFPGMLKDIAAWHVSQGHETFVATTRALNDHQHSERAEWARTNNIELLEISLPVDRGASLTSRFTAGLRYAHWLSRQIQSIQPDLLLCGTQPPLLASRVARRTRTKLGTRFVYYVQDLAPEMLALGGPIQRLFGRLMARIDRDTVKRADTTITLSDEMKACLLRRPGARGEVAVLRNFAIDQEVAGSGTEFASIPRIIFAGNTGKLQNIDHFLRAVRIASRTTEFTVTLIGGGSQWNKLQRLSNQMRLENVQFLSSVPREEAQRQISKCDIGLVAACEGLFDVAFPSKMNSYLLAGIPSLVSAPEDSSIARWLETNNVGSTIDPACPKKAATQIIGFLAKVARGNFDRKHIRDTAQAVLSPRRYFEGYGRVILPLLSHAHQSDAKAA